MARPTSTAPGAATLDSRSIRVSSAPCCTSRSRSLRPQLRDPAQQGGEPRPPVRVPRREVGAGEERLLVGRQEHRHGPAALALVHRLGGGHVDVVEVGPLLAIDLHVHEMFVHDRGRGRVLERLVGHHMAPVARRVADGEQDRLLLGPGPAERLLAPLVPVHRVVGVLEEVGTGGQRQPVGRFPFGRHDEWYPLGAPRLPRRPAPGARCSMGHFTYPPNPGYD